MKTKVSSLTSTVAEAYVQFMQFKTQTTANLNTVNSSVNTNTGKITDLSTYVNNHVSSLTNITNTHDASIRSIITKQAAHDSSIIDHDARLKANQSSITWLVDSEEQQDNLIATLQNEIKALTEVVTDGADTEFITEMISNVKTECKNYTDTQLEPFMQLKSLGIMTGEDKTKIIDSLNGKVDSSAYAADVSVLTYSIYDIKNRYDKKFTELDYKIQNGGNDVVNANIAELERRISELENKFNVYQTLNNLKG